MNGYEKMKRLRRTKITKAISAVTALSMTVTGLIVAANANSADPDYISKALGGLTDYGIVADQMTTASHSEASFAVNNLKLNDFFDTDRFINTKSRTVTFNITSEETFEDGETKTHYLGVYCNNGGVGELVEVEFAAGDGATASSQYIAVEFDTAGTKTFSVTIPERYKYEPLVVHKLEFVVDEEAGVGRFEIEDAGTTLLPFADNVTESYEKNTPIVIGETLEVSGEKFGTNKTVYVGPEIYKYLRVEGDGRVFYDHNPLYEWRQGEDYWEAVPVVDDEGNPVYDTNSSAPIANNTNRFVLKNDAPNVVNGLLNQMQTASDTLAQVNVDTDLNNLPETGVISLNITGSVYSGSDTSRNVINKCFAHLKSHPDCYLLVNVTLEQGDNVFCFNDGAEGRIQDNDLDTASRIVFNFIGKSADDNLVILDNAFAGTALAANARVSVVSTFAGAIYAPQVTIKSGEVHMATYRAFSQEYWAEYFDETELTTETTTEPETETTTSEEETTTTPETTTSEEATTTPPETTTSEEATTTPPETTTSEEATTTPPETTTSEEATTPPPETTTSEEATTTPPTVTTPEEAETTPGTTPPVETTTTTTTPRFVIPETTTTTTVPTETPEETTTTPEETTTTPEETTTTPEETTTTPEETTTTPEETTVTTEGIFSDEGTTTTTPSLFEVPETTTTTPPPSFEIPETTPVSETTTVPPTETTTAPPVTTVPPDETTTTTETTVTVPVTVKIDEDVPRGTVTPDVPIIMIDERVPLSDRPMNTGVESKVGMFAVIGGAALMIGIGAQVYSVILKKKH